MASQKRSISIFDSDSVGSIISVPGDRKAHGRRVEAVVDQPLCDVVDGDAAGVFSWRGSTMHSCATRPRALRYSTGKCGSSLSAM